MALRILSQRHSYSQCTIYTHQTKKRMGFIHILTKMNYLKERGLVTVKTENAGKSKEIPSSFQEGSCTFPSMKFPLQGVEEYSYLPDYLGPVETTMTTLPCGLRIGSENSSGPCVSVGLVVDSGCIYEDSDNYGVTHLLEKMVFGSTKSRSRARFLEELRAIGISMSLTSTRDQMVYISHGIKTFLPHIVELIVDSVRNSIFKESEVREKLLIMKDEVEALKMNPQSLLMDNLHLVGYAGDYSKSFSASESSLSTLNGRILREFVNNNFTAPRMVLSASGVNHIDLLAIAEPLFSDLPKITATRAPNFEYIGGDWRQSNDSPITHFALAFEVPNGWQNEELANHATVLKFLLGGGESFSTGGPGKGMYTWLYRHVLRKYQQFNSIVAFTSIYKDTGLFGVHVCTGSQFVPDAVDIVCKELMSMATPGKVSQRVFERAKNATISAVLMSLESKEVAAQDIAAQILSYGHRRPINRFVSDIRNMTLQNLQTVVSAILSRPPTLASWGAVNSIPAYSVIEKRFNY